MKDELVSFYLSNWGSEREISLWADILGPVDERPQLTNLIGQRFSWDADSLLAGD
jgi:hypothetical protein